jgi:predicted ferric reductase
MKSIKVTLWGLFALLTAAWFLSDSFYSSPFDFMALMNAGLQYTGIIAIAAMSVSMILAIRPRSLENWFDGLDKMYRLHKWMGIAGFVFAILHWGWKQSPEIASGLGLITMPPRGPRPAETAAAVSQTFSEWWQSMGHPAGGLGNPGFYALIVLVVLALVKWFPYKYFGKTHRLLAVVYLVLVFHSLFLIKLNYWTGLVGPLTGLLMLLGTISAIAALLGRIGTNKRAVGTISELSYHKESQVLKVGLTFKDRWKGHDAGQFAFVAFAHDKEPHPFTIGSAWAGDGKMFFLIKEAGDFTARLLDRVKVGDLVTVEGPYGKFDFTGTKARQIWIAAGIGIAPFVSRMNALALKRDAKEIDLFFTSPVDDTALDMLKTDAKNAGIGLHITVSSKEGRLDAARIMRDVPDFANADIWYCGPTQFGQQLNHDFTAAGLADGHFHQEMFEMR